MNGLRVLAALPLCLALLFPALTVTAANSPLLMDLDSYPIVESKPDYVSERYGLSINTGLLSQGGGAARLLHQHRLELHPTDIEHRDDGRFTWRGRLMDASGEAGSATLTVHDQRIRGTILLNRIRYQVSTDRKGRYWMDRIDPDSVPDMHPPGWPKVPEGEPQSPLTVPPEPADDGGAPVTDVIVFYTRNAIADYNDEADLRLAIRNAVDNNNTALINSEIDGRVRLVGLFPTEYQETGTGSNVLNFGRTDSYIQGLRNDYSADLVAMITDDRDVCGVAWLLTSYNANWNWGVSMTSSSPACLGGQTFAHELGHNMGLHHDPANVESPEILIEPFAYGHFVDGEFRTIMSYWNQCNTFWSCPQIDHFSDPAVNDAISGLATGTAERNNAEVLRLSMPYVAQWREQPADFADALGQAVDGYQTGGDSPWVVQDRVTHQGSSAALSGPVYGSETSWLEMDGPGSGAYDLAFRVRATVDDPVGELSVYADGEWVETFSDLPSDWMLELVSVPENTDTLRWQWTASNPGAAPETVGAVLLSAMEMGERAEAALSGQVFNAVGDRVEGVSVAARSAVGDTLNRPNATGGDGSFQFSAQYLADQPPQTLLLSGIGVQEESFGIAEYGCEGIDGPCDLTVTGEPRVIGGTVEGLLSGESISVSLMENGTELSESLTADSQGMAEFAFQADALFDYGALQLDVAGTGYTISSEAIESVDVRAADAGDLMIVLSTQTPSVLAVQSDAGKDSLSVSVTIDAAERASTVSLSHGSGEDATVLEQSVSPTGPGEDSVSFDLTGLACGASIEFDIEVVNDHGQTDSVSESATTEACSGSDSDSDSDRDSGSGSSCSLNPGARPDPLLGLLLLFALAGLLRRAVV